MLKRWCIFICVLAGLLLVAWVIYVDWTLPSHPIDPKRIESLKIFHHAAQPEEQNAMCIVFEGDALKQTVHQARLSAGGLSNKFPKWKATARLDDGTELRLNITHVGYFEIEGQRGVYELPRQPDLFLKAAETMKELRETGKATTLPIRALN